MITSPKPATWRRKRLGRVSHIVVRTKNGGLKPKCGRCTPGRQIEWKPERMLEKRCRFCLELEAQDTARLLGRPLPDRRHVIHAYIPKGGGALRDVFMLEETPDHPVREFMRGDTHLLEKPVPGARHVRITIEVVPAK